MKAVVLWMFICCSVQLLAQENWQLVKAKKGIEVYVAEMVDSDYYAFKAMMWLDVTQQEIVHQLRKVSVYPEWFAYTARARLISQNNEQQSFFMETDYPWPFSNECMNYKMSFEERGGEQLKIVIEGLNDYVDCKYRFKKASGYILLETVGKRVKITYYFHCEPEQYIPTWLINPNIHEMPYRTFVGLRSQLSG